MALTIPQQQPMGVPNNMLGDIDIQKYGIQSISTIAEATWSPRILIKHLDGKEFSYTINRTQIEDIKAGAEGILNKVIKEHIRKECIVALRKEKLLKLNEV